MPSISTPVPSVVSVVVAAVATSATAFYTTSVSPLVVVVPHVAVRGLWRTEGASKVGLHLTIAIFGTQQGHGRLLQGLRFSGSIMFQASATVVVLAMAVLPSRGR